MERIEIGPIKKIILLGGGELLLRSAELCQSIGLDVKTIISPRHSRDILRNYKDLNTILNEKKIPTLVVDDITKIKTVIGDMKNAIAISISAPWIFNKNVIEGIFDNKLFNIHGARLPKDKGGAGVSWNILRGNRLGMCLIHFVDEGIDTGPILKFEEFIYPPECRIPQDYINQNIQKNFDFLSKIIHEITSKKTSFETINQPDYLSTYFPRLHTPTNGWIDWNWKMDEIERFICAFDKPYEGARTRWKNQEVILRDVIKQKNDGYHHPFQSGLVYRNNQRWLMVSGIDGELIVRVIEDKNNENIISKIKVGDRFFTLPQDLSSSKQRVFYDSYGLRN